MFFLTNFVSYEHQSFIKYSKFFYAENLSFYPAEHVIYGDYVHKIWDEDLVKNIIGFFTPENMRVDIVSKSFSKLEGMSGLFSTRLFWLQKKLKRKKKKNYDVVRLSKIYACPTCTV